MAILLAAGCLCGPATRADVTVADCTEAALRTALTNGGTVSFASDCSIALAGPIFIQTSTAINAGGHQVTLSGTTNSSMFIVSGDLTLQGLTLSGATSANGGALYVQPGATVVANSCVFSGNKAVGANGLAGANGADVSYGTGGAGGGGTSGAPGFGGAIYNLGTLTLLYCTLTNNSAEGGNGGNGGSGGNAGGTLGQGGDGGTGGSGGAARGGAVYNGANLTVIGSTIALNSVIAGNAGLGGAGGTGRYSGFTASGGAGAGGAGGGIYNALNLTVGSSTFSANVARGGNSAAGGNQVNGIGGTGAAGGNAGGGGLATVSWSVVTNCTFYNNSVQGGTGGNGGAGTGTLAQGGNGGNGGNGIGGSIDNTALLTLVNCTVANSSGTGGTNGVAGSGRFSGSDGNRGQTLGGGIARINGSFTLLNTLLSTNTPGGNGYGAITDAGHNLSSDTSIALGASSYQNTDPKLGTLANNGGPTLTMALLAGSPALDQISSGFPRTDQRGVPRPQNTKAEIGAYEYDLASPPIILQGPTNEIVVAGAAVTFSVTAAGGSPLTYQWRLQGTNITNAISTSYTVASTATTNEGPYDVVISNTYGVTYSSPVFFHLTPAITSQPASQVVNLGSNATFSVVVAGDLPLFYQWSRNLTNTLTGATNSGLTRTNVQMTDIGSYTVSVTNGFGSVVSTVATLDLLPAILTQPTSQTVYPGQSASFNVGVVGSPPLRYQWRLNSTNLAKGTNATYVIASVAATNGGNYDAIVSNPFGSVTSTVATLTVRAAPVVTSPLTNQLLHAGDTATFLVAVTGTQPLSFQWQFNGAVVSTATNSVYTIANVQNVNLGAYLVVITNAFGGTNSQATLNLLPTITSQPASQAGTAGTSLSLGVGAAGSATLAYQWRYNGAALANATRSSLTLSSLKPSDGGNYDVVVTNSFGAATSAVARVTVVFTISGHVRQGTNDLNGVAVLLTGGATGATLTTNGNYTFSGLQSNTYAIFPSLKCFAFAPTNAVRSVGPTNATADFSASPDYYTIQGQVTDGITGRSNVTVQALSAGVTQTTNTDVNGYYFFSNLCPTNYTLIPTQACQQFFPVSRAVTVGPSAMAVNFTAFDNNVFAIRGKITTDGSNALTGVSLTLSNTLGSRSLTNVADGSYTFSQVCPGHQTVVPSSEGYGFTPASRSFTVAADTNGIDFIAFPVFTITGRILDAGTTNGRDGVTILLGGSTNSVTTTNDGYFTFSGLSSNLYTLTPVLACYLFSPTNLAIQVGPTNDTAATFSATHDVHRISGTITQSGQPLNNVLVQAVTPAGQTNASTTTAADGSYIFPELCSGSYTVAPALDCALFFPASRAVTLAAGNPDADFSDFVAYQNLFPVSGQVTTVPGGAALPGVTVVAGSHSSLTDANGHYSLTNLCPGTIRVSLAGYKFDPAVITVASETNSLNFRAFPVLALVRDPNGLPQIQFGTTPGLGYQIQASTNLINWRSLFTTNNPLAGVTALFQLIDADSTNFPMRFYRVGEFPWLTENRATNGTLQLSFVASPGLTYTIQASSNLVDWQTLSTTNNSAIDAAVFQFTDSAATNYPVRFYRLYR